MLPAVTAKPENKKSVKVTMQAHHYAEPITPIVKWAGGKRFLLPEIGARLPKSLDHYVELFLGGGALLFKLCPDGAIVNDSNVELMNVYDVIKKAPRQLITHLGRHKNTESYYYALREKDRDGKLYSRLSPIERASRTLYLNKTCYNGLFRVNKSGEFNAPFGRYKNPDIVNRVMLQKMSDYFNDANILFYADDFEQVVAHAPIPKRAFFFFDPPYMPLADTLSFTGYTAEGFSMADQKRLCAVCVALHQGGHQFLLSNAACPEVVNLYRAASADFVIDTVLAKRNINCKGDKRGAVNEVLIRNYHETRGKGF